MALLKKLLLAIAILCTLGGVWIGLLKYYPQALPQTLNPLPREPQQQLILNSADSDTSISFGVSSEVSGVVLTELNQEALFQLLELVDYKLGSPLVVFGNQEEFSPKRVHIVFRDISTHLNRNTLWIARKDSENNILVGADSEYVQASDTLMYYIYTTPFLSQIGAEKEATLWSTEVGRLLFFLLQKPTEAPEITAFEAKLYTLFSNTGTVPLFTLVQESSYVPLKSITARVSIAIKQLLSPKPARACSGTVYECGVWIYVPYGCPAGNICSNTICLPSLIEGCGHTPVCDDSGSGSFVTPCDTLNNINCNNTSSVCNQVGNCASSTNFCYPQGSGGGGGNLPTPTPTPSGTPPPNPGAGCNVPGCQGQPADFCAPGLSCQGGVCLGAVCPVGQPQLDCGDLCQPGGTGSSACSGWNNLTCDDSLNSSPTYGVCWGTYCEAPSGEILFTGHVEDQNGARKTVAGTNLQLYLNGNALTLGTHWQIVEFETGTNNVYFQVRLIRNSLNTGDVVILSTQPPANWYCNGWSSSNTNGYSNTNTYQNLCSPSLVIYSDGNTAANNNIILKQTQTAPTSKLCNLQQIAPEYTQGVVLSNKLSAYSNYPTTPQQSRAIITTDSGSPILNSSGQQITTNAEAIAVLGAKSIIINSGVYYYSFSSTTDCLVGGGTENCEQNFAISNLPVDTNYNLFCDIPAGPNRCSGNPFNGDWTTWARCANQSLNNPQTDLGPDRWEFDIVAPPCQISCTQSCNGQTWNTTPTTPSGLAVVGRNALSGEYNMSTSPTTLNLSWTTTTVPSPGSHGGYDVWIMPQSSSNPTNGATNATCTGSCRVITTTAGFTTTNFTPLASQGNQFKVFVRTKNTCGTTGTWSSGLTVDLMADVTGTVYDITTNPDIRQPDAGNNCSAPDTIGGDTALDLNGTGSSITSSVNGVNRSATLNANGSYTITVPYGPDGTWSSAWGGSIQLSLGSSFPSSDVFVCRCPNTAGSTTCTHTSTVVPAVSTGAEHFFISSLDLSNSSWWKTSQGHVFSKDGLTSNIPQSCVDDATCNPYFVDANANSNWRSAGVPITSAATIQLNGYFTQFTPTQQPRATSVDFSRAERETYAFFTKKISLSTIQQISTTSITTLPNPSAQNNGETELYYSPTSLTLNIDNPIAVSGRKATIFVDGDLTINSNAAIGVDSPALTVSNDSFLGFIVSGDIIFRPAVGRVVTGLPISVTQPASPVIEGVFVADGSIIVSDYADSPINSPSIQDKKFVAAGTYVSWSGFMLNRAYENTGNPLSKIINNTNPVSLFQFRPDFIRNFPEVLKTPNIIWQETN